MTKNMTKNKLDAVALLKADHRKVEGLFEKFEHTKNAERKKEIVQQILTELVVHTTIEEEIFYPACNGKVDEDLEAESYVEHDGAKVIIAELANASPEAPFYDAKVTVLKEEIEHHVKEEERPGKGLFAQARAAGLDMEALGEQMSTRKKQLMAQIKAEGLPTPQTRSFSGHELKQGKPVEPLAA